MGKHRREQPTWLAALLFAACVSSACGDLGSPLGGAAAQVESGLRAGPAYPATKLAFVLVDMGNGVNMTVDEAMASLAGPAPAGRSSLQDFVFENSYGTQALSAQVFGPLPMLFMTGGNCNTAGLPATFRSMVDTLAGGPSNHYIWYFGPTQECMWSHEAEIGTASRPANDGWMNGVLPCNGFAAYGGNAGLLPSSLMRCGVSAFADDPNAACTETVSGDPFDPMGGGCGHVNAWHKAYSGWLLGCNGVRVRGSGTFTLLPLELPCDGVQLLQIPMARQRSFLTDRGSSGVDVLLSHYYLELRTGRGADSGLATAVQIRVAGELRSRDQRPTEAWVLDANPATAEVDGMKLGETFSDPAGGVAFTVTELDDDHAQVTVMLDGQDVWPTCLDGLAFSPPGLGIASCDPVPATGGRGGMPGTGGRGGMSGGVAGSGGRGGMSGAGGSETAGSGASGAGGSGSGGVGAATGGSPGRSALADRDGCGCELPGPLGDGNSLLLLAGVAGLVQLCGTRARGLTRR
jgi:hypothetical protein